MLHSFISPCFSFRFWFSLAISSLILNLDRWLTLMLLLMLMQLHIKQIHLKRQRKMFCWVSLKWKNFLPKKGKDDVSEGAFLTRFKTRRLFGWRNLKTWKNAERLYDLKYFSTKPKKEFLEKSFKVQGKISRKIAKKCVKEFFSYHLSSLTRSDGM